MLEEWRRLIKCGEVLFVSSFGNVISDSYVVNSKTGQVYTRPSIVRKQHKGNHGYYCFRFRGQLFLTHRLVAECFVSGDVALEVNHIDGIKTNNRFDNLEWVTSSENNKHAWDMGLKLVSEKRNRGESHHNSKLNDFAVYDILSNTDKPCSHFAKKYGVSVVTINDLQTGKKWKHLYPDLPRKTPEGGKRKLSEQQIRDIRDSSLSSHKLAKMYKVSVSSIRDILKFITYKEVK